MCADIKVIRQTNFTLERLVKGLRQALEGLIMMHYHHLGRKLLVSFQDTPSARLETLQGAMLLWLGACSLAIAAGGCLLGRRRRIRAHRDNELSAAAELSSGDNDQRAAMDPAQIANPVNMESPLGSENPGSEREPMSIKTITSKKKEFSTASLFQLKRDWLSRELLRAREGREAGESPQSTNSGDVPLRVGKHLQIVVRRDHIFQDSYLQFSRLSEESMRLPLSVHFVGEAGRDDGGMTRDWYSALSREIFNPDYALFTASAVDDYTYQVNPSSGVNPDHLEFFHFVGMVVGKALTDSCLLDAHFTRLFYKSLLGKPVGYRDMASVDLQFFHSICWLLENDIRDMDLGLTFTMSRENFGAFEDIELKEKGSEIAVTEENKLEYVNLLSDWQLRISVEAQTEAVRSGMARVVDPGLLQHFDEAELEWLIGGLPHLDATDWRRSTVYKAGYEDSPSCPTIQWFWQLVDAWDQEMRARLLQFVTGTSKVPYPEGFKGLKGSSGPRQFHIVRVSDFTRLPQAHTCFNELILPEYDSMEELASNLHTAIFETGNQFQLR